MVEDMKFEPAVTLAILSAGVFFLIALLTGIWKWRQMMASSDHRAHFYVDTAHRASLMYSFSALLLAVFAWLSAWSDAVNLAATAAPLFFFAGAIGIYIVHGFRAQTENQFADRNFVTTWGMIALIAGELGGFVVLLVGCAVGLLGG